jgi:hypothetical protein
MLFFKKIYKEIPMNTYINDLYEGKIYPAEQIRVHSEEYQLVQEKLSDLLQTLEDKLEPPLADAFEDFVEQQHVAFRAEAKETFLYGFKLGVNLIVEALDSPPKEAESYGGPLGNAICFFAPQRVAFIFRDTLRNKKRPRP